MRRAVANKWQDLYFVRVVAAAPNEPENVQLVPHPLLLPHEVVGAMYRDGPATFSSFMLGKGGVNAAEEHWRHMRQFAEYGQHPVATALNTEVVLPLGFYGDAAKIMEDRKMLAVSFNSIMARGPTFESRVIVSVIDMTTCVGSGLRSPTLEPIWKTLAWSFRQLAANQYPSCDADGQPLTGHRATLANQPIAPGYAMPLLEFRGDWEFHAMFWEMNHYYNTRQLCHQCTATNRNYQNYDQQSPPRTTGAFMVHGKRCGHPFFSVPFSLKYLRTCSMHCLNLGIGRELNGALLAELIKEGWFGNPALDVDARLKVATSDYRSWCRQNRVRWQRQPPFSAKQLWGKKRKRPILLSKAWNSRLVTAWLADTCHAVAATDTSGRAALRAQCAMCFAQLYDLPERHQRVWPQDVREEAGVVAGQALPVGSGQPVKNAV